MVEDVAVVDGAAGLVGERDPDAGPAPGRDEDDVLRHAGDRGGVAGGEHGERPRVQVEGVGEGAVVAHGPVFGGACGDVLVGAGGVEAAAVDGERHAHPATHAARAAHAHLEGDRALCGGRGWCGLGGQGGR